MRLPKYIAILALSIVLLPIGFSAPQSGSSPPIVDEEGNTLTPEEMTARLAEGDWIAEPQMDRVTPRGSRK